MTNILITFINFTKKRILQNNRK